MTNYVTLIGSRSLLDAGNFADKAYPSRKYRGVTLYGSPSSEGPVWLVFDGESSVYCLDAIDWPEEGTIIQGLVITNPTI